MTIMDARRKTVVVFTCYINMMFILTYGMYGFMRFTFVLQSNVAAVCANTTKAIRTIRFTSSSQAVDAGVLPASSHV